MAGGEVRRRGLALGMAAVALALSGTVLVAPAGAAPVACGQVIVESTVLDSDVGPCPAGGLRIEADGVVLDLAGHRIFGTASAGDSVGIQVRSSGVTIKNGTVSNFDRGIHLFLGNHNTLTGLTVRDNVGATEGPGLGVSGEGITLTFSDDNVISGNSVVRNGPLAGILVLTGDRNVISRNVVANNDVASITPNQAERINQRDTGIKLDSGVQGRFPSVNNVIEDNVVRSNGYHGIAVAFGGDETTIRRNHVTGNGVNIPPRGLDADGILVSSNRNLVSQNSVTDNTGNGIHLDRLISRQPDGTVLEFGIDNLVERNLVVRNGGGPFPSFDLRDDNEGCVLNDWIGNRYGTASHPCLNVP